MTMKLGLLNCKFDISILLFICMHLHYSTFAEHNHIHSSGADTNNNPSTTVAGPQSNTPTQPTTSPSTTTKVPLPTITYRPYPIPTGTWVLSGELVATGKDCINTINSTTFREVWACNATEAREIVIHDVSAGRDLAYWLDLEGTNVKGVPGIPPTGDDTDRGESPLWTFIVPDYLVVSPAVPFGCEVQVTLKFLLSNTKVAYGWIE